MRSKELEELVSRAPRRNCVKAQTWEGYQEMSAALKGPNNTVVSIILQWKKFGRLTLTQTEQLVRRAVFRGGEQEPNGHSDIALEFLCGDGRTFQKDNHLCSTHQSGLYDRVDRRKQLLSKRHMTACMLFAKSHLKTLRP